MLVWAGAWVWLVQMASTGTVYIFEGRPQHVDFASTQINIRNVLLEQGDYENALLYLP